MNKMKITTLLERKSPYVIYHDTYSSAIQEVENYMNKKKFILDPEEMSRSIGMGPSKPGAGKTNRFSLKLYKTQKDLDNFKEQKRHVHFQVYGMGSLNNLSSDRYELNCYIS